MRFCFDMSCKDILKGLERFYITDFKNYVARGENDLTQMPAMLNCSPNKRFQSASTRSSVTKK